jgi:hypothetical protein
MHRWPHLESWPCPTISTSTPRREATDAVFREPTLRDPPALLGYELMGVIDTDPTRGLACMTMTHHRLDPMTRPTHLGHLDFREPTLRDPPALPGYELARSPTPIWAMTLDLDARPPTRFFGNQPPAARACDPGRGKKLYRRDRGRRGHVWVDPSAWTHDPNYVPSDVPGPKRCRWGRVMTMTPNPKEKKSKYTYVFFVPVSLSEKFWPQKGLSRRGEKNSL